MTQLLNFQLENQVATITLQNGKVNAISHELIAEMHQALDQAEKEQAVVVITGQPGILSGGYDLKVMQSGNEAAMALVKEGSSLSRRLLAFPTPVIVACSGHAVAKGAFLLLSADVRIGVDGPYKIGLNEVAIGMTMHYAGIGLARGRLPAAFFNRSVLCAEMFDPKTAIKAGFLDMVVPEAELGAQAHALATQLSKLNMTAHKNTKLKARAEFLEFLDEAIEKDAQSSL